MAQGDVYYDPVTGKWRQQVGPTPSNIDPIAAPPSGGGAPMTPAPTSVTMPDMEYHTTPQWSYNATTGQFTPTGGIPAGVPSYAQGTGSSAAPSAAPQFPDVQLPAGSTYQIVALEQQRLALADERDYKIKLAQVALGQGQLDQAATLAREANALQAQIAQLDAQSRIQSAQIGAEASKYASNLQAQTSREALAQRLRESYAEAAANPRRILETAFLSRGEQLPTGAYNPSNLDPYANIDAVLASLGQPIAGGAPVTPTLTSSTNPLTQAILGGANRPNPAIVASRGATSYLPGLRGGGRISEGPVIRRVGEKGEEAALLMPGSVIAPLEKGEAPATMDTAMGALVRFLKRVLPGAQAGVAVPGMYNVTDNTTGQTTTMSASQAAALQQRLAATGGGARYTIQPIATGTPTQPVGGGVTPPTSYTAQTQSTIDQALATLRQSPVWASLVGGAPVSSIPRLVGAGGYFETPNPLDPTAYKTYRNAAPFERQLLEAGVSATGIDPESFFEIARRAFTGFVSPGVGSVVPRFGT